MLSFEISVIDIVLVLAIIVLLVLYATRKPTKPPAEPKLPVAEEKGAEKPSEAVEAHEAQKSIEEGRLPTRPQTGSPNCPHRVGYLKKLPKDAPIPDECFTCPKMAECACG